MSDSIVDEIHRVREAIHDKFNGDIAAMVKDAQERTLASGRPIYVPKQKRQPARHRDEK